MREPAVYYCFYEGVLSVNPHRRSGADAEAQLVHSLGFVVVMV